jgi:hypothetical protein
VTTRDLIRPYLPHATAEVLRALESYGREVRAAAKVGALMRKKGKKGKKGADDRWVPRTVVRGGMSVNVDDDGAGHVRGASYDPARAAYGYTLEEVDELRRILNAGGYVSFRSLSREGAEGLLSAVLFAIDERLAFSSAMTAAERKARSRARARLGGKCLVCALAKARRGMVTCQACSDRAKVRVLAGRRDRAGDYDLMAETG